MTMITGGVRSNKQGVKYMWDGSGNKIKKIAKIGFWLEIIVSGILLIIYNDIFEINTFLLWILSICGTYVTNLFIYAFGQLVDSTENIESTANILRIEIKQDK